MAVYTGVIIEESLEDRSVLVGVKIVSTSVSQVTPEHATPWLKQWTLHSIEVPETQARNLAERLSNALDHTHAGAWYADFKSELHHYVIYRGKVFYIDRSRAEQYAEAKAYGISLGIPERQVDFDSLVLEPVPTA